jgi:hypothetical protein
MDLNESALASAKGRIEHENGGDVVVETVKGDALAGVPKALQGKKFDSVSLFNLMHCFPAGVERKTRVFGLAAEVLSEEEVLVGCTILGREAVGRGLLGWVTMFFFNLVGAFGNWGDTKRSVGEWAQEGVCGGQDACGWADAFTHGVQAEEEDS